MDGTTLKVPSDPWPRPSRSILSRNIRILSFSGPESNSIVTLLIVMESQSLNQLVAVARSAGYYWLLLIFLLQGHLIPSLIWTQISHNSTRRQTWCCYSFCHFLYHFSNGFSCYWRGNIAAVSMFLCVISDYSVVCIC